MTLKNVKQVYLLSILLPELILVILTKGCGDDFIIFLSLAILIRIILYIFSCCSIYETCTIAECYCYIIRVCECV